VPHRRGVRLVEPMSKRRRGFDSEAQVKRGRRSVKGGAKELSEKLGSNDPCPCGSGRRLQELLPEQRPLSTESAARTTTATSLRSSEEEQRVSAPRAEVRLLSGALTPWPSGEARACNARSRRFESARCLHRREEPPAGRLFVVLGKKRLDTLRLVAGRGAAWLARQSGGLEVPSSNLGAPMKRP
jgi:SEC-C motif-containing protein